MKTRIILISTLIIVSLLTLSCSKDLETKLQEVDKTPPTVVATNPSNNEIDVSIDKQFEITFSEDMDLFSINENTIMLVSIKDAVSIPLTLKFVSQSKVLAVPNQVLESFTDYRLLIKRSCSDVSGNSIGSNDLLIVFKTADVSKPVPISYLVLDKYNIQLTFSENIGYIASIDVKAKISNGETVLRSKSHIDITNKTTIDIELIDPLVIYDEFKIYYDVIDESNNKSTGFYTGGVSSSLFKFSIPREFDKIGLVKHDKDLERFYIVAYRSDFSKANIFCFNDDNGTLEWSDDVTINKNTYYMDICPSGLSSTITLLTISNENIVFNRFGFNRSTHFYPYSSNKNDFVSMTCDRLFIVITFKKFIISFDNIFFDYTNSRSLDKSSNQVFGSSLFGPGLWSDVSSLYLQYSENDGSKYYGLTNYYDLEEKVKQTGSLGDKLHWSNSPRFFYGDNSAFSCNSDYTEVTKKWTFLPQEANKFIDMDSPYTGYLYSIFTGSNDLNPIIAKVDGFEGSIIWSTNIPGIYDSSNPYKISNSFKYVLVDPCNGNGLTVLDAENGNLVK